MFSFLQDEFLVDEKFITLTRGKYKDNSIVPKLETLPKSGDCPICRQVLSITTYRTHRWNRHHDGKNKFFHHDGFFPMMEKSDFSITILRIVMEKSRFS